jgi:hypothetical protein
MKHLSLIMMLAATGLMACSSDDKNDVKEEPRLMIVDVQGITRGDALASFVKNA